MPNQSLVDLTERTATADTDLIHVNSGGTDYKQTKINFLRGDFFIVLSNSANITSSAESLEALGTYFGSISSYGHQSETGVPENTNFYFKIQRMGNANYISIELWNVNNVEGGHYIKSKVGGTWGDWVKVPSRSEITSLNNSLANSLKLGDWTANLTLPYTPTSDGFISVWLNPSSASGAYARLSVTGDSHAMGLNAKGGDGVTLVFPIKKNATVSQAALSNGTLSVRFISIFG